MEVKQVDERLERARASLEGLAVGDAFGGCFFTIRHDFVDEFIAARGLLAPPWYYTDDTLMALSVYSNLRQYGPSGRIDQDRLARSFAARYDLGRGYGPNMHGVLRAIGEGMPWDTVASAQFGGQGSYGNGAAMRVAPLGAYFADDLDRVVEQARRSAEVTHAHPEAIAGAIAVAVAAAWATRLRGAEQPPSKEQFLDLVLPLVPHSEVRSRIRRARELELSGSIWAAVDALGNGLEVSAQDTVPFVLWCAAQHLDSYEDALWLTASGLGDVDTTCAMVGGIVACYGGVEAIPAAWRSSLEPLPDWHEREHDAP